MKIQRRQLVLAALVVALGAAVYLNYRFSNGNQLLAQDTAASHELGQTQLVNAGETPPSSASSAVSSAASSGTSSCDDYFTEARLNRQKTRDSAAQLLEKTISNANSSDVAKKEAVQQTAVLAQEQMKENNAENIIKAKGFSDCVVFMQNNECSVIVKEGSTNMENAALIVKDAVSGQTGVPYDKIKVVEKKGT